MKRWLAFLVSLAALALACSSYAADSKMDQAKRAYDAGDRAYAAGEYLAAARAYENAFELYPSPSITFSAAQAYRRCYFEDPDVRWLEKAQALYRRYLSEQPTGGRRAHAITHLGNIELLLTARANEERPAEEKRMPLTELLISSATPGASATIDGAEPQRVPVVRRVAPGQHRIKVLAPGFFDGDADVLAVEGRLSIVPVDLKARPGSLRILSATNDAGVWIDGRLVAHTPLVTAFDLPAGRHAVYVGASGRRPLSQAIDIERGRERTLHVNLDRTAQRVAAYWTLAGAGAFALAGTVTAILAVASERDAEDARSGLGEGRALTPAEVAKSNDALETRNSLRTLSIASFGLAAVAGTTGTLLVVFDNPTPRVANRDSGRTFGIGLRGAF